MSNEERQAALEQRFNSMSFGGNGGGGGEAAGDANSASYYQPQSASARFERFFNTGPPSNEQTSTGYGQLPLPSAGGGMSYHLPQHQQQQYQQQTQQQQYFGNAAGAASGSGMPGVPAGYGAYGASSGIFPSNMGSFGNNRARQNGRNGLPYQWESSLSPGLGGNVSRCR